jgi:transposase
VELFEQIRRDHRQEGLSIRALARRHRVHRRAVRDALESAVPPARKEPERSSPALGPWQATVRGWLQADREVPRKQRHTARRVWQRLSEEYGAQVAESTVRTFVAQVRRELGDAARVVTVPQTHLPGEEAEVDFGEFYAYVAGVWTRLWMFCMRLSCSGRGFHIVFAHQAQEAFLEGHALAFEHFGGVPGRIRYDNLKPAVIRVLKGRNRIESDRFVALRSHYGFDSFFCIPGLGGAHEKGGVEGEVGRFRRRHLVPVPRVDSLSELNAIVAAADLTDDARVIGVRTLDVGEAFRAEAGALQPLPGERFDTTVQLQARVDTKARVCVRQSFYSVPVRWARRRVIVRLGARALEMVADGKVVAVHARSLHKGSEDLVLDHYLEVLDRKPGALAGSTALAQARRSGAFTDTHEQFWLQARRRLGDAAGTRALCRVLLLHRSMPAPMVIAGITAALQAGVVDVEVVAIEARRAAQPATFADVTPISPRIRLRERPAPSLDGYDTLLTAAAGGGL